MKLIAWLMMLLTLPTVLGCAKIAPSVDDWCATNEARRPTAAEYAGMDRLSKEAMHDHNMRGARWCGWRPS